MDVGLHSAMQSAAEWTINESQKHYQNSCEERKIGKTLARKIDKISKQPIMIGRLNNYDSFTITFMKGQRI